MLYAVQILKGYVGQENEGITKTRSAVESRTFIYEIFVDYVVNLL